MRRSSITFALAVLLGACGGGESPSVAEQVAPAEVTTESSIAKGPAESEAADGDAMEDDVVDEPAEVESTTTAPETTATVAETTTTEAETTTTVEAAPARSSDFCQGWGDLKQLSTNFNAVADTSVEAQKVFTLEQSAMYAAIRAPDGISADFTLLKQTYLRFNADLDASGYNFADANPMAPEYLGNDEVPAAGRAVESYDGSSC